ncbi:unnamed protein product [Brassicogethes aeneus]|uniref:Methyltransferase domain-containing protein n=2 Tax=Brassicogethes aeneus TaxID=1431903 RepID=A0A9P0B0H2_BRAAE|nr:unnamed protein product [Brassicogethes aeneus]
MYFKTKRIQGSVIYRKTREFLRFQNNKQIMKGNMAKILRKFSTTTVDPGEIKRFSQFNEQWWDKFGPMRPLHSMNKLRVPMIREGLANTGSLTSDNRQNLKPLAGLSLLDVGCGGGILSEPLARLGGCITGLDANESIIDHAQKHSMKQGLNISYSAGCIEDFAKNNKEKFDAIVASEIIEHVTQKEEFLKACLECLKPNGSIFITTINKTTPANFVAIFLAEDVVQLVPKGTHEFEKFIEPHKLQRILEDCKDNLYTDG